jgi:hypothetical protein
MPWLDSIAAAITLSVQWLCSIISAIALAAPTAAASQPAAFVMAADVMPLDRDLISQASAAVPAAKQSPFYCDQGALTPTVRKRHFEVLGPRLIAKRMSVRELPDGYEFQLPSDAATYKEAAEFIDAERLCCPFFDISLRATPEGGPLWMRVTGRPGTKQFIAADGADWISPVSLHH